MSNKGVFLRVFTSGQVGPKELDCPCLRDTSHCVPVPMPKLCLWKSTYLNSLLKVALPSSTV